MVIGCGVCSRVILIIVSIIVHDIVRIINTDYVIIIIIVCVGLEFIFEGIPVIIECHSIFG